MYSKAFEFIGRARIIPEWEKHIKFALAKTRYEMISRENEECSPDGNLANWKKCLNDKYDELAGCVRPWLTKDTEM